MPATNAHGQIRAFGDVPMPGSVSQSRPQPVGVPTVGRPSSVSDAIAAHVKIIDAFTKAEQDAKRMREAAIVARAEDIRADARRVAAGQKPLPAEKRTAHSVDAEAEEAERRLAVLREAGTTTRRNLLAAVLDQRDSWADAVGAEEAAQSEAYRTALAQLEDAASRLAEARGAAAWLGGVGRDLPTVGFVADLQTRVGGAFGRGTKFRVGEILAGLADVAAPAVVHDDADELAAVS